VHNDLLNSLSSFFRALSSYPWWAIAIELLVIGALVFSVVEFLRGTRGARMLKTVMFVLVGLYLLVWMVERSLGLERLAFLYDRFLAFAFVATVVVFQPELRRALMRLGEARLFRSWSTELSDEIESLVQATSFLSRRKIGALIAIERDIGLGGIAESGHRVGADLSAEILETIFWPNSPLHDLGVVISQGKVAYAGVQFPLAETGELERELGSRHRAAVGMSQESDAVVLVVSEETGDVSVAERGRLVRKLNPESLRGLLKELLGRLEASAAPKTASVSTDPAASI
jgi:diadenylate cyclase